MQNDNNVSEKLELNWFLRPRSTDGHPSLNQLEQNFPKTNVITAVLGCTFNNVVPAVVYPSQVENENIKSHVFHERAQMARSASAAANNNTGKRQKRVTCLCTTSRTKRRWAPKSSVYAHNNDSVCSAPSQVRSRVMYAWNLCLCAPLGLGSVASVCCIAFLWEWERIVCTPLMLYVYTHFPFSLAASADAASCSCFGGRSRVKKRATKSSMVMMVLHAAGAGCSSVEWLLSRNETEQQMALWVIKIGEMNYRFRL